MQRKFYQLVNFLNIGFLSFLKLVLKLLNITQKKASRDNECLIKNFQLLSFILFTHSTERLICKLKRNLTSYLKFGSENNELNCSGSSLVSSEAYKMNDNKCLLTKTEE